MSSPERRQETSLHPQQPRGRGEFEEAKNEKREREEERGQRSLSTFVSLLSTPTSHSSKQKPTSLSPLSLSLSPSRRRRRLILMRHAPSADAAPEASSASTAATTTRDHDRPITEAGVAAAKACARALRDSGWLPDLVLASDALRSRQTLDAMREEVPELLQGVRVRFAGALYAAAAMDDNQTARALAATLEEALSSVDGAAAPAGLSSPPGGGGGEEEVARRDAGKGASSSPSSSCSPTTVLAVGHNKVRYLRFRGGRERERRKTTARRKNSPGAFCFEKTTKQKKTGLGGGRELARRDHRAPRGRLGRAAGGERAGRGGGRRRRSSSSSSVLFVVVVVVKLGVIGFFALPVSLAGGARPRGVEVVPGWPHREGRGPGSR